MAAQLTRSLKVEIKCFYFFLPKTNYQKLKVMQSMMKTHSINFSGTYDKTASLCEDWSFWKGEGRCVNEKKSNWEYRFPAVLCNYTEIDCNLFHYAPLCCLDSLPFGHKCSDFETLKKYDNLENLPSSFPSSFKKLKFSNYHFCNRTKVYVKKGTVHCITLTKHL